MWHERQCYSWAPFLDAPNKCELNCQPEEQRYSLCLHPTLPSPTLSMSFRAGEKNLAWVFLISQFAEISTHCWTFDFGDFCIPFIWPFCQYGTCDDLISFHDLLPPFVYWFCFAEIWNWIECSCMRIHLDGSHFGVTEVKAPTMVTWIACYIYSTTDFTYSLLMITFSFLMKRAWGILHIVSPQCDLLCCGQWGHVQNVQCLIEVW